MAWVIIYTRIRNAVIKILYDVIRHYYSESNSFKETGHKKFEAGVDADSMEGTVYWLAFHSLVCLRSYRT